MSGKVMPSSEALALHGLKPVILAPKEALGVMNGTSFSASVAALVTFQSIDAIILAEVGSTHSKRVLAQLILSLGLHCNGNRSTIRNSS